MMRRKTRTKNPNRAMRRRVRQELFSLRLEAGQPLAGQDDGKKRLVGTAQNDLKERVLALCRDWSRGFPDDPGCMWAPGWGFDWGLSVNAGLELDVHGDSAEEIFRGICSKVVDELDHRDAVNTLKTLSDLLSHRPDMQKIVSAEFIGRTMAEDRLKHNPLEGLRGLKLR